MPRLVNRLPKYRKHKATGQAVVSLNGSDVYLGKHGTAASRKEYDRRVSEWVAAGRHQTVASDGPVPKYRKHKASSQAVVTLNGRDLYLGPHGTAASKREYDRVVSEWIAAGRQPPGHRAGDLTVNELLVGFLRWAKGHYRKGGKVTDEFDCIVSAIRPLKELYGIAAVAEVGPLAIKTVREKMIAAGWSRGYCNRSLGRIKRAFRWGVENELVPPATFHAIKEVAGLQAGRSKARETAPREPVPQEHIDAVRKVCRQKTRDLIDLMLLTAARPSELFALTGSTIDATGDVWVATLPTHKMQHKGTARKLYFGPQAKLILQRYSKIDPAMRLIRSSNLRSCIIRACDKARVPRWTPYQLRHTAATRIREQYGLEAAQVILGHARADVTQIYAARNEKLAVEVAQKVG